MAAANSDFFAINQLPDSILVKIFLQLERMGNVIEENVKFPYGNPFPPDNLLLPPIASVCSRWRRLYFQPQMWRSKVLRVFMMEHLHHLRPESQFFTVLNRMAGEIRNLHVRGHGCTRALQLLPTFPSVEQLIFDTHSQPWDFEFLMEKFPAVKSMEFGPWLRLDDAIMLQMASGWPNLREFVMGRCRRGRGVTEAGLIRFVQRANQIESLNISGFPDLTDSDLDEVTMALGVRLKSITFGYQQELLTGLAIHSLVFNCPSIEQICLEVTLPIGPLKDLAQLKRLKLTFSRETVEFRDCHGIEDLFSRPLSQFRSFEAEDVNNLTDSQLELIANSCPQLESLSLSHTRLITSLLITDSGLAHIVDKCRNLRVLSLKGLPMLKGRSFIGAGAKLPNLSRLKLNRCENIDAEMVRRAFVRSTRLQIESDLPGPWDLRRF